MNKQPSRLSGIPKGWIRVKFSDVMTVRQGLQIAIAKRLNNPTSTSKEYITIQSINNPERSREYVETTSKRVICTRDDVLMTRTGNTGIVVSDVEGVFHNNFFLMDFDISIINKKFLINYLRTSRIQHIILTKAGASTIPDLNHNDFYSIDFPLPPLPEQRKIAQILSTWDKAIATTEKQIANSKQQKKALMQQLLTGKKRLAGFSGDWEVVKLGELLHERKARNKDNKIQTVLSVTNHSGFVLPEEQFSKRVASSNVSNYKIVKKGEFGYNPSRINVGSFARLDDFEYGILSPMYVVFSLAQEKLNSDYFLHWMSSNEARQRILGSTQGSVRDSVGFDALCSFPFRIPPLKEQQKIAQVLTTADNDISTLETQLTHLQQEKKSLMQQLLTGKRRVLV